MQIFSMNQPQQHIEPQVTLQNLAKGNSHPEAKAILDKKNILDFSSPLRRSVLSQQGLRLTGRPINLQGTSMENKGCYWGLGQLCTEMLLPLLTLPKKKSGGQRKAMQITETSNYALLFLFVIDLQLF